MMTRRSFVKVAFGPLAAVFVGGSIAVGAQTTAGGDVMGVDKLEGAFELPGPGQDGGVSIEKCLQRRRSVRHYKGEALSMGAISQLLWAAQGITAPGGYRTAPSAGALYPLELYLVAGKVDGLPPGVYKYVPHGHRLLRHLTGDKREDLRSAALGQSPIGAAPASIVMCGVFERTTRKYGERGIRYVHMEVGHVGQNIHLQAISLGLGAVVIGAFDDSRVNRVLNVAPGEQALYIMPVGG